MLTTRHARVSCSGVWGQAQACKINCYRVGQTAQRLAGTAVAAVAAMMLTADASAAAAAVAFWPAAVAADAAARPVQVKMASILSCTLSQSRDDGMQFGNTHRAVSASSTSKAKMAKDGQ